jgi:hypothetical protein
MAVAFKQALRNSLRGSRPVNPCVIVMKISTPLPHSIAYDYILSAAWLLSLQAPSCTTKQQCMHTRRKWQQVRSTDASKLLGCSAVRIAKFRPQPPLLQGILILGTSRTGAVAARHERPALSQASLRRQAARSPGPAGPHNTSTPLPAIRPGLGHDVNQLTSIFNWRNRNSDIDTRPPSARSGRLDPPSLPLRSDDGAGH